MKFSDLEGKRLAIWGYGNEGRAALASLRQRVPTASLSLLCNENEAEQARQLAGQGLAILTGAVTAERLAGFDVVIKSPGISPYHGAAAEARQQGVCFTSGTALWFGENPQANTLCVTGTKGKSTTTALMAHMLRAAGTRTALAGNIGLPLLDLLDITPPPQVYALELSSYQTREARQPRVAVVLNIYPEHLDWHGSQERYIADKLALATSAQPQQLVLNAEDPHLQALGQRIESASGEYADSAAHRPRLWWFNHPQGWHVRGQHIHRGEQAVLDGSRLALPGTHNLINLCAALTAIEAAGFDAAAMAAHASSFRPLPHRLQPIGQREGRDYINDSISTTPYASLAALDHYAHRRVAILVGGYDRGLDWSVFCQRMQQRPPLAIITCGQNGPKIAQALQGAADQGHFILHQAQDMPEAVQLAEQALGDEGVVLLSPGAPSFPRYRDYAERGRHFAQAAGFNPDDISTIPGLGASEY